MLYWCSVRKGFGQIMLWEGTAMAKMTPIVRGHKLVYQQDEYEQMLVLETPAWYAWLETASSFAFTSEAGTFTARKERAGNQRSEGGVKMEREPKTLVSHGIVRSQSRRVVRYPLVT